MGTQPQVFKGTHKRLGIVPLVSAHRGAALLDAALEHPPGGFPLGTTVRFGGLGIDDQSVAVLRERVGHVAQLRFCKLALLEQAGVGGDDVEDRHIVAGVPRGAEGAS
jgi:hypothetical protein